MNAPRDDEAVIVLGGVLAAAGFIVALIGAVAEGIRLARPR